MARLGDICKFQSGGTPSKGETSYFNGNIPWITTVALNGSIIDESNAVDWITEKAIEKSAAKIVPANSVMVGTRVGVGKVAINKVPMSTSQDIISLLDIDESKWSKEFICKYILGKGAYLNSQARGATIKGIKIETLAGLQLPDFPIELQCKIATVLDAVDNLIALRKEQIAKLDQLVKSRFIELFGDPIDNPLNWKVADFKEVVYFQEGPGVRNWQFRDSGIKLINIRNLVDDSLVLENTNNYLSEQEVEEKYKHFLLDVGDYVMASSGVTWGKIAEIYEEHLPLCLNTSIIRLRPYDETVISKKYLFHYIKGDAFRMQIRKLITGSAQPNYGPTHLKKISIIVPPIELQNQFAAFVEQTDKSKLAIQQSLDKLELLKKSLMQEYFG